MIPSLVASEVEQALRDFLTTQFQPSNPELSGIIDNFLSDRGNLLKGPYLSIALPYQRVKAENEPFSEISLGFAPYRHQQTAFERLSAGKSTIVATGTGSGKTECFLYPILDWCRKQSGEPGIKAILIYPMNALATDQAGRIARIVNKTQALRGRVTAGIYIGEDDPSPHSRMSATRIVSNRKTLVERPPDILLTNYKMLDYLLSRPKDQRLWRNNGPDTLRWLVVDELHTFDGAQGTDLACLIRRLKSRLGASGQELTCVGTSATLGEAGEDNLREYVGEIFGSPFETGSIVGETRQSIDQFLANSLISDHLMPRPDLAELVDHARFESTEAYIRAQYKLFFGEQLGSGFLSDAWRVGLAERLRGHSAFINLLRTLAGHPKSLSDVIQQLRRSLSWCSDAEALGVLHGLCALISIARVSEASGSSANLRPFLQVSLHLWVRELRRMVCSLHEGTRREIDPPADIPDQTPGGDAESQASSAQPPNTLNAEPRSGPHAIDKGRKPIRRLRHSDDIGPDESAIHLPLVQCHQCRVTGWGAVLDSSGDRVRRDLRHFYNQFFARDIAVKFLFPEEKPLRSKGHSGSLCGACGHFRIGEARQPCSECGTDRVVTFFVADSVLEERKGDTKRAVLSRDCPFCGSRNALFIFGARSTVLLSVALGQTYASRHNDDHKVIAFSDNVQDAAHRAGYFSHRTWRNSKRAAIAQTLPDHGAMSLADLPGNLVAKWSKANNPSGAFWSQRFVSEFIAPDRTWLRDFKEFQETGRLVPGSNLPALVKKRLEWESLAEFGFANSMAHSLERAQVAAAGPDITVLKEACEAATAQLREEIGELKDVQLKEVRWMALGVLRRMKNRGAIFSNEVEGIRGFLASGCNRWNLTSNLALQEFGPGTPSPVFPAETHSAGKNYGIEPITMSGGGSWYQRWIERVLFDRFPMISGYHSTPILQILLSSFRSTGLAKFHIAKGIPVWAIDPERFQVTAEPMVLRCTSPTRALVVPSDEAPLWLGAPCLELGVSDTYERMLPEPPTWAGRMYRQAEIRRVVAEEHTALLTQTRREHLQSRFAADDPRPWDPNMLSATPTLELGIDIGDLSTVALCSVPPAQANYLQRIGRAGRRDGNAFTVTLASAQPHDLFFYAEPLEMLDGTVTPPGVFLNASAVLERQLTSFCLDNWAAVCDNPDAVPRQIRLVLDHVQNGSQGEFPYTFFAYIAKHDKRLLGRFFKAFEESLTDDSKDHLRVFLKGKSGDSPRLEVRILERLEQVIRERRSIRADMDRIRLKIRELKKLPADEANNVALNQHLRERAGLSRLLGQINNRNTFAFLTDEGLIPNYSFPEEGVKLRSVILRRPPIEEVKQATIQNLSAQDLEVYEYLRPSAAALGELAPNNLFYAEGNKVKIDRVDLQVSGIEEWRLCPSCPYCECIDSKDEFSSCPRCGDPMWADAGQARNMLPLTLVHATTAAKRAQIMDDRDDRESTFFTRELVADFDPTAERKAYAVPPPGIPFAFEYVAHTTFREMNFGRVNSKGQPTKFAGNELPREGFRICRHCGKVQSTRPGDDPEHTLGCRRTQLKQYAALPDSARFGDEDGPRDADSAIVDCLYLYREFDSESLRMLIPVVEEEGSGPRVQSFIAAVELGLREKFRGRIDHLRMMTGESGESEGSARRKYLILYDTVPGGTGYLKQLATTPSEIVAVFEKARKRLRDCECEDGCYRCVFAYRRRRDLQRTSKRIALKLVDQVLEHTHELEPVAAFENIKVEGLLESNLEARFVRALEQRADTEREMRFRRDIVRGKSGYVLQLGAETWYVEPQADLNRWQGVEAASRPDFLFHPAKSSDNKRSVAVFLDGFRYHKTTTGEDSIKRMALIRGGYLQWSLTWHDLEVAFGGTADAPDFIHGLTEAGLRTNEMKAFQKRLDADWSVGPLRARMRESSFELLLRFLEDPDFNRWKRAVFVDLFRIFEQSRLDKAGFQSKLLSAAKEILPAQAADALPNADEPVFVAGRGVSRNSDLGAVDLFVAVPRAAITQRDVDGMFVALHLHDRNPENDGYRETWNGTLRLFNLIQFLPNSWWTTSVASSHGSYAGFAFQSEAPAGPNEEWTNVVKDAEEAFRELLLRLASLDVALPEVGYELADSTGTVVGEAEIAWVESRTAVLRDDQESHAAAFEAAGWRVWKSDVTEEVIRAALQDSVAVEV